MADVFNKTVVTFAGIAMTGKLRRVQGPKKSPKVRVTGANDDLESYEIGIADIDTTVEVVGKIAGITQGQKGALVVTWPNAATDGSITNAACLSIEPSGTINGELLYTYTFCPSTAP